MTTTTTTATLPASLRRPDNANVEDDVGDADAAEDDDDFDADVTAATIHDADGDGVDDNEDDEYGDAADIDDDNDDDDDNEDYNIEEFNARATSDDSPETTQKPELPRSPATTMVPTSTSTTSQTTTTTNAHTPKSDAVSAVHVQRKSKWHLVKQHLLLEPGASTPFFRPAPRAEVVIADVSNAVEDDAADRSNDVNHGFMLQHGDRSNEDYSRQIVMNKLPDDYDPVNCDHYYQYFRICSIHTVMGRAKPVCGNCSDRAARAQSGRRATCGHANRSRHVASMW